MKSSPGKEDNRLSAEAIRRPGGRLGHTVIVLPEVGSTNDELKRRAEAGAPEGVVILAESQTRGRGRLQRRWESPRGKDLLASVLLRPGLPAEQAFRITLLAGVAVAETLARDYGLQPRIKWPNDVLVRGRKLCGILAELRAEKGKINYIILGLGINLNLEAEDLPAELRPLAGSVRQELHRPVDRAAFARDLLAGLESRYQALLAGRFSELLSAWHRWAALEGQEVTVGLGQETISGLALGLDQDGALRVWDSMAGIERRIVAGDVQYLREQGG